MFAVIAPFPTTPCYVSIGVNRLVGNEILVYRCPNSKHLMMLTRIRASSDGKWQFGFVPVGGNQYPASYAGYTFRESASKAAMDRSVYGFSDLKEFAQAIVDNKI